MLEAVAARTEEEHDIALSVGSALRERILRDGSSATFGARPLRRTVQRLVEDVVAETFLDGSISTGDDVLIDACAGGGGGSHDEGVDGFDRVVVKNLSSGSEKVVVVAATAAGIEDTNVAAPPTPGSVSAAGKEAPATSKPLLPTSPSDMAPPQTTVETTTSPAI